MNLRILTHAVAAFAVLAASPAFADHRSFKLINRTGVTMERFYSTESSRNTWGPDLLGRKVVRSGYSAYFTVPGKENHCVYDFRMSFSDGDVVVDTVDLCKTEVYTIR